jgi:hypothetical protein
MPRPLSEATAYARSLGLTPDQLRHLGGLERVRTMPAEQRELMVSLSRQNAVKQRLSKCVTHSVEE